MPAIMTTEELAAAVQTLQDRQAIHDCLMTYSRGIDRLDRELLLSVYHPDAVDDHGVFVGGPEAFVDWAFGMHSSTHLSHQHCIFNYTVDLAGDVAHTEAYYMFIGMNRTGNPTTMSAGRYIDRFEKRGGRWAIAARVCVRDWAPLEQIPETLDQSAMTAVPLTPEVEALARGCAAISRDRNDVSYQRPVPARAAPAV